MDKTISLYYYVRPVLGVSDEETERLLETDIRDDVFIVRIPPIVNLKVVLFSLVPLNKFILIQVIGRSF